MAQEPNHWQQLVQHLDNPEDAVLAQEIQRWQAASDDNDILVRQAGHLWQLTPELQVLDQLNIPDAVKALQAALPPETPATRTKPYFRYLRIAASVTLLCCAGYWLFRPSDRPVYLEKHTYAGQIDSVQLSDGSTVYLDHNSRIRYPENMRNGKRTVWLEQGNAFFQVQGGPDHPFVVQVRQSAVTVLGTSFNLQLDSATIRLSVKTGKVQFTGNRLSSATLQAGQGLSWNTAAGTITRFDNVNTNADAWLTRELVFVEAPLQEVCEQLETVYHVNIRLDGPIPLKLNAAFKNNTLEQVLEILQAAYPLTIQKNEHEIIISNR